MAYSKITGVAAKIRVVLTGLLFVGLAEPVQGASSIYNMGKLLSEPYPFAIPQPAPSAPLIVAPVATPGAPARSVEAACV